MSMLMQRTAARQWDSVFEFHTAINVLSKILLRANWNLLDMHRIAALVTLRHKSFPEELFAYFGTLRVWCHKNEAKRNFWSVRRSDSYRLYFFLGLYQIQKCQNITLKLSDWVTSETPWIDPLFVAGDLVKSIAEIASVAPATPFIYYHNPRTHVDCKEPINPFEANSSV